MSASRSPAAPRLSVVSHDLPEPPYDSDVAANGFSFEIDLPRMQNSDSWLLCPPEVRPWMMMTWVLSWAQHPCGSLPDDDERIAVRLGCTLDFFQVHRRHIMRGWVLHDDGRFYHPVVTERVIKMLEKREGWKVRQGRRRAHDEPIKAPKEPPPAEKSAPDEPVTRESRVSHAGVTGESRDGTYSSSSSSTSSYSPPRSANALVEPALGGPDLDLKKNGGGSQTKGPPDAKPVTFASVDVRGVFDYWREVMEHPNAVLDNKRSRAIAARLKHGYSVEQLKRAVDGCRASPWHQGQNDRHQVYDDIELICRDAKRVEAFLTKAEGVSQHQRDEQRELDAWLNEGDCIEGEYRHVQA